MDAVKVNVETGKKKVFVSAQRWPGWSRSGKDLSSALLTFSSYASRYGEILQSAGISDPLPSASIPCKIIEQLPGNATTDFGAPSTIFQSDHQPLSQDDFDRYASILQASWARFDAAVGSASGKELIKGPRGGGRDLDQIIDHIIDADIAYLPRIAWKYNRLPLESPSAPLDHIRKEIQLALAKALNEGLPTKGPRGETIWPVRYYFRRSIWHILDHAWEIEDRLFN